MKYAMQTTSPESKFPIEYSEVIFIQIDQHLKKLLQKYKGVPILWITVSLYGLIGQYCVVFYVFNWNSRVIRCVVC